MIFNRAFRGNPLLAVFLFLFAFAFMLAALRAPAPAAVDPTIIVVVDETTYQASPIALTFVTVPRKEVPPAAPGAPVFLAVGADTGSVSASLMLDALDAKAGDLIAVAIVPNGETIGEQDIATRGKLLTPDDDGKVSLTADVGESTEADRIYTVAAITLRKVE